MILENLIYFLLAFVLLTISAGYSIKLLGRMAVILKISNFAAASFIMAIATSLPELFVGITSSLAGTPVLSLGNILGANMLDMTLILGIIILVSRKIEVKDKGVRKDLVIMSFSAVFPLVLFLIGNSLSRIDGLLMIAFYIFYAKSLLKRNPRTHRHEIIHRRNHKNKLSYNKLLHKILPFFYFTICIALIFISAGMIVKYASNLAVELSLPAILIGIFLISFGTTIPELTFGLRAAMLGKGSLGLGDQIGTVIFNANVILGVTALIHPIEAEFAPFMLSSIFLLLSSLYFLFFLRNSRKLGRKEGIFLIIFYLIFLLMQIYMRNIKF